MLFLLDASSFCYDTAGIWGVLGWVVVVLKIVIPLILIVLGMIDLGKAVVSSDEKAINKSVTTLVKRFIAAIVIFFIPTIVSALFNAVVGINVNSKEYNACIQCVTNVSSASKEATYNYCKSNVGIK